VVLATAGVESSELLHREVRVRGRDAALTVEIVNDVDQLRV
jgi:hypothetical protein